jgi:hypothetical protein
MLVVGFYVAPISSLVACSDFQREACHKPHRLYAQTDDEPIIKRHNLYRVQFAGWSYLILYSLDSLRTSQYGFIIGKFSKWSQSAPKIKHDVLIPAKL